MTKKDFEFIAAVIRAMPTHAPSLRTHRKSVASTFAHALAANNPLFKLDVFLKACGEETNSPNANK